MQRITSRIIKSNNVKLHGKYQIGSSQNFQCSAAQSKTILTSPQVKIVESHPEYAVIEFVCSCGEKTTVRCEYDGN